MENSSVGIFTEVPAARSQVTFTNDLEVTDELNPYTYRNFYNGGGVAVGDIDNDGLLDLYFAGNLVDNQLYLNQGGLAFRNITDQAGVACHDVWSTGVAMVDVNGDGWLDIYVCKAGPPGGEKRHNELFINQGDLSFVEQSAEYGLDITSMSVHSAWLDYDRDGDLDMYLLSNSIRAVGGFDFSPGLRDQFTPDGNKLFRNDGGVFTDVTKEAGIYSNAINYGLDVAIEDFNLDGWPDIFVSNDFFERDYLYINQQDGTFREEGTVPFDAMSMGSMGVDVADINQDLVPDLFVTEMLPEALDRKKTKAQYEVWDKYQLAVKNGYHHQFARNMMHLSEGPMQYGDVSRLTGTDATEWSWSALLRDFDNDADIDLHVTNGIGRDLLDKDYLNYVANESVLTNMIDTNETSVFRELVDEMPQSPIPNKLYINDGNGLFQDQASKNQMGEATYSNGSVAADLDRDGDLDLVINNIDQAASIFENHSSTDSSRHWLQLDLRGKDGKTPAVGASATLSTVDGDFRQMLSVNAGFESSHCGPLHFGLGPTEEVSSVHVLWPDGSCETIEHVEVDQYVTIQQRATMACQHPIDVDSMPVPAALPYRHKEPTASQFVKERLITHMRGLAGPALLPVGEDTLYVGGGKHQASALIDAVSGNVLASLDASAAAEVTDAVLVDIDADGDLDIYEAHGGKLFSPSATALDDVIWRNKEGNYQMQSISWSTKVSTRAVAAGDIDRDGHVDMIVAEGQKVQRYGLPGGLHLLSGQENGTFTVKQPDEWKELGMISDIAVFDIDGDRDLDVIAVGHWMPITVFYNDGDQWTKQSIEGSSGLWNCIEVLPQESPSQLSFLLGNQGLNSVYEAGMQLHLADFDDNGTIEQVISKEVDGKYYSIQDLDELFGQLPILRKRYTTYDKASKATIEEMFGEEILGGQSRQIDFLGSAVLQVDQGSYSLQLLPRAIQQSSVHAIEVCSMPAGVVVAYLGGNHYRVKPQFGRDDASFGWAMRVDHQGDSLYFHEPKPLGVKGQIRDIICLEDKIFFGLNDDQIQVLNADK